MGTHRKGSEGQHRKEVQVTIRSVLTGWIFRRKVQLWEEEDDRDAVAKAQALVSANRPPLAFHKFELLGRVPSLP